MQALRSWMLILASMSATIGIPACQSQETQVGLTLALQRETTGLALGPGDLIDLTVFHLPELILKVRVGSDGTVNLPLLGEIKLGGMSVRDAEGSIAQSLMERQFVIHPEVSIFVEEYATQGMNVSGEVAAPGVYQLLGPHRLYDAIAEAGGFTSKAGRTVTIIHSPDNRVETIDLSTAGLPLSVNVRIFPGDTIMVAKAGVVYVLGEVNKPGAFLLENNTSLSVLKAIALAQGTTKVASLRHAVVIRSSSQGRVVTEIPLNKICRAKAPDLQLKAEDIVFVPVSNVKSYGAMGVQGAIQAAIYTAYAAELH